MHEFGLDVAFVDATNRRDIIIESRSSYNDVRVLVFVVNGGGGHVGSVPALLRPCSSRVRAEIAPARVAFGTCRSFCGHQWSCTVVLRRQCVRRARYIHVCWINSLVILQSWCVTRELDYG